MKNALEPYIFIKLIILLRRKSKKKKTLNYSQNSIKINFIDKDEYIKITGYEISDFNFKLQIQQNTTVQDNGASYVIIDEKDILINDISKQDK